ncbi:hypothetical protein BI372_14215 [Acinetobacter pittii]|nr:hypothetical protein BI372_14215 [Acinetobacter pittii]
MVSIIIITFFLIKPLRDFAYYPTNMENLTKLENELIKNFMLCEPPKLEYFNKDYLFYEIEIENKKRVYVIESKKSFPIPIRANNQREKGKGGLKPPLVEIVKKALNSFGLHTTLALYSCKIVNRYVNILKLLLTIFCLRKK